MKTEYVRFEMPKSDGGWKTRHSRLFEALGGAWNRRRGYHIRASRAKLYADMLAAGWDAGYKGIAEPNRLMETPNGEKLSVRDAVKSFNAGVAHV